MVHTSVIPLGFFFCFQLNNTLVDTPNEYDDLVFDTPEEGIPVDTILITVLGAQNGNIKDLVAKACIEYRKFLFSFSGLTL